MPYLTPADLAPFAEIPEAKASAMIADAEAQASMVAPCITEAEFEADVNLSAVLVSILRGAVLRWHEAGSGAVQTAISGPFSQTTQYQARRAMFWPSEIADLQKLCQTYSGTADEVFAIDTAPRSGGPHQPWCALMMGANYCSCGADLTNYQYPLYEGGALS